MITETTHIMRVEELEYYGASITVELHRGTIDPQGIGSDEELESCREYILDAVREAFPGADVRAVGNGGRTGASHADGREFTREVREVERAAWDAWCAGE